MKAFGRIRLAIAVVVLAVVYWLLLDYTFEIYYAHSLPLTVIRYLRAHHIPVAAWIYPLYATTIAIAAVPVAVASIAVGDDKAVWIAAIAGAVAPAVFLAQSLLVIPGSILSGGDGLVRMVLEQVLLFGAAPALTLLLRNSSWRSRIGRLRAAFVRSFHSMST